MWSGIYQNPYSFFFIFIYQSIGGGGMAGPFCPLAMPETVLQPGFVNGGQREWAKRPFYSGRGCGFPSHGREIFENSCMKTAFILHIKWQY